MRSDEIHPKFFHPRIELVGVASLVANERIRDIHRRHEIEEELNQGAFVGTHAARVDGDALRRVLRRCGQDEARENREEDGDPFDFL
ncbi:hypothetical protein HNR46_000991 [Haloferula luteola]|uniref:Uncharacterized protein n=1 Tax=Haloferula luteola TaxID=595692 RepID=A0A840UX76_9BACT|nr:hypothetical protein [Haloferula luteola]